MRPRTWLSMSVGVVALAFAGVAVADQAPLQMTTSTASVSATSAAKVKTTSCTNAGVTFQTAHGSYSGTATGPSVLNGPIRFNVQSMVNTSTNVGILKGNFQVNGPGKGATNGKLDAVVSGGTVSGFIQGHGPSGAFEGPFTGSWNQSTGFSSLSIGSASASTNQLLLVSGHCPAPKPLAPKPTPPKHHKH